MIRGQREENVSEVKLEEEGFRDRHLIYSLFLGVDIVDEGVYIIYSVLKSLSRGRGDRGGF